MFVCDMCFRKLTNNRGIWLWEYLNIGGIEFRIGYVWFRAEGMALRIVVRSDECILYPKYAKARFSGSRSAVTGSSEPSRDWWMLSISGTGCARDGCPTGGSCRKSPESHVHKPPNVSVHCFAVCVRSVTWCNSFGESIPHSSAAWPITPIQAFRCFANVAALMRARFSDRLVRGKFVQADSVVFLKVKLAYN
jgi:hypothetical protein